MAHPHIPDDFLENARGRLEAVQARDGPDLLGNTFQEVTDYILHTPCCSLHVSKAFQLAKDAVFNHADPRLISAKQAEQLTYLSVLAIDLFSSKARSQNAVLRNAWESAAWEVVSLAVYSTPEMGSRQARNHRTIAWVTGVFCRRRRCPNPFLRLELIRFIAWWTDEVFQVPIWGTEVLCALVELTPYLSLHELLPRGRPSLSGPLFRLLQDFHENALLEMVAFHACRQIDRLEVDEEAQFFAHLVKLQSEKAKVLRYRCLSGSLHCSIVMDEYRCLLETLSLLVSFDEVFNRIGLRQVAAASIAVTVTSLFKCYSRLEASDKKSFNKLKKQVNGLIRSVRRGQKYLLTELMTSHGGSLERTACLAKAIQHLPNAELYKPPEDCSARFLDAVTGKLMEEPVEMVLTTYSVSMDISTLVGLMLFSKDSYDYFVDHDLRDELRAWRMGLGSDQPRKRINLAAPE